jgi:hypothetical protein
MSWFKRRQERRAAARAARLLLALDTLAGSRAQTRRTVRRASLGAAR